MSGPTSETLPLASLIGGLRPPEKMEVSHALLCTYSLDIVVLAAAIGALAGVGGDDLELGRVALARSLRELRGKVRVLAQAGRVQVPKRIGPFHALLLDYVADVRMPKPGQHWHPKLALVRYVPVAGTRGAPCWSLWLGSHNLVRSTSWELGGSMRTEPRGQRLPGLNDQIPDLLKESGFTVDQALAREIASLKWAATGESLPTRVLLPGRDGLRWVPQPAACEALIVSPFLDATTLEWSLNHLPVQRDLVTTRAALADLPRTDATLQRLLAFRRVLTLGPPGEHASTVNVGDDERAEGDDAIDPELGLHAKALCLGQNDTKWTIQFGSANATRRGLGLGVAANAEVVAEVPVTRAQLDALLAPVLRRATPVVREELEALFATPPESPTPGDRVRDELGEILEAWDLRQTLTSEGVDVVADAPPAIPDGRTLALRTLLGDTEGPWRAGTTHTRLQPIPPEETSDYLLVVLRWPAESVEARSLIRAPATPPRTEAGDLLLIRRVLGPRGILQWLQDRIDGVVCDDVPWDTPRTAKAHDEDSGDGAQTRAGAAFTGITIEGLLRA